MTEQEQPRETSDGAPDPSTEADRRLEPTGRPANAEAMDEPFGGEHRKPL